MKIIISVLLVFLVFSCRDKIELLPNEFYTGQIPVKNPTNLLAFENILINEPRPFSNDSLVSKVFSYSFYKNSVPVGKPENLEIFDSIDFSDIIFFNIEEVNPKFQTYTFSIAFSSNGLKKFLNKYKLEAKNKYGPNADVGFSIGFTNPEGSTIRGFGESFNFTAKFGTSINVDLIPENKIVKLQDLCQYYQNRGTASDCTALKTWLVTTFKKGDKFKFGLGMGCTPDGTISLAYGSNSKTYEINILDYVKK